MERREDKEMKKKEMRESEKRKNRTEHFLCSMGKRYELTGEGALKDSLFISTHILGRPK